MLKRIIIFILRLEAQLVLWRFRPKIIGITGSVGKTSTKEAIATLLSDYYRVGKSRKSYNSEIGLPLAILGLESPWRSFGGWVRIILKGFLLAVRRKTYPTILVLEMGVDRPGDLDKILRWVKPTTAVVTAIGSVPVHVEFFANPEALAEEKAKILSKLKEDEHAIISSDDALTYALRLKTKGNVLTYGFDKHAMIRGSAYKLLIKRGRPDGITFKIDYDGKTMPIRVEGVAGKQVASALLAAAAIGITEGLNLIEIGESLRKYRPEPGRLRLLEGKHGSVLIDDSYNSSPLAAEAALELLMSLPAKRKIAALGDMLELGKYSPSEHRRIGALARASADHFITVGIRSKGIENVDCWFSNSEEAGEYLTGIVQEGDAILIKGSQGMRMERVTQKLLLHPEEAPELLVRQEAYWKNH